MTKHEIFEKLQTEVTIRGLSPGTYYTYKRAMCCGSALVEPPGIGPGTHRSSVYRSTS